MIRKYLEYAERIMSEVREAVFGMIAGAALVARLEEVSARIIEVIVNTILRRVYSDLSLPGRRRRMA